MSGNQEGLTAEQNGPLDELSNHAYNLAANLINRLNEHEPAPDASMCCKCGHDYLSTGRGIGKHRGDIIAPLLAAYGLERERAERARCETIARRLTFTHPETGFEQGVRAAVNAFLAALESPQASEEVCICGIAKEEHHAALDGHAYSRRP